jgi:hypothetical protein
MEDVGLPPVTPIVVFDPVAVPSEAVVLAININGQPIFCRVILVENMGWIPDTELVLE